MSCGVRAATAGRPYLVDPLLVITPLSFGEGYRGEAVFWGEAVILPPPTGCRGTTLALRGHWYHLPAAV